MKHSIYNTFRIALLAGMLLCAGYFRSAAQKYPVKVQVQLLQPVSPQLADLYTGTQARMIVTLLNTDLQSPTLSVRLRFIIKGGNAVLRSKDYVYYQAIQLDAGIPLRLSVDDLAPYFQLANLDASGIPPSQLMPNIHLPDGYYTFCVEAVEVNSGQQVSNSTQGCSPPAWISVSQPPLLNLPVKGGGVAFRDPLNIIFNWTPRHMSSANAAFQTEYEFTLTELWDTVIAPEAAFLNSPPLYQTTTATTTLLYGPAEPPLLPGKRYAWRVKAKAKLGADEFEVFLNNGYSEIYWFVLQENCQPPQQVLATIEENVVTVNWLPQPQMSEYIVEYREANKTGAEWFSMKTTETRAAINDAVPGRSYEYRVGGYCVSAIKTMGDLHGFDMPARDTADNKNCGLLPDIKLANQEPIKELKNGDQIMAGDFPVRLTTVSGAGTFQGAGYIMIPFLGDTKVKVKFNNITVNTSRQLLSGVIQTTFDSLATQVVGVDKVVQAIKDLASVINDLAHLSIDSDYLLVKDLADEIRKMAENELPEDLKERITKAADNLEQAKKDYDNAKAEYDNAKTPEEKAAAKDKKDKAAAAFEEAKKEVDAVNKEKEELVKSVTDMLVKAVKKLKSDYDDSRRTKINEDFDASRTALNDLISRTKKALLNGKIMPDNANQGKNVVVIAIDSVDVSAPVEDEFSKLSVAFKEAELQKNKVAVADMFDQHISSKEYYAFITQVLRINGKNLVDYIVTERNDEVEDDVIVDNLKVELEQLITDLLNK
ncbi:fibronectin type III domain-containing protein [Chitinophaga filiformis]|uniref:fibronectin type III domain-containing protein n=1 Tax=Chitinophaga filiformis TaxID=104663 RepID=UPI001F392DCA|nr:fibronectin type III domain-containing protein [Chitinophaga filiformis]MCF6402650.1 fibronectin type III domain-containing protein [Chitinophaga filiformis]MCF6403432.1 fibronectin type III domain-containing protein [Chitinophaga filiformis]